MPTCATCKREAQEGVEKTILTILRETHKRYVPGGRSYTTFSRDLRRHNYFVCAACQRRSRKFFTFFLYTLLAFAATLVVLYAWAGYLTKASIALLSLLGILSSLALAAAAVENITYRLKRMAVAEHPGKTGWVLDGRVYTKIEALTEKEYEFERAKG